MREPKSSIQDEDEYSGTKISSREVAQIKRDVQGVMKQQFAQARARAKAISRLEQKMEAQLLISKYGKATA